MDDPMDVVAIGAHPDDVELWAGGTVCSLTAADARVAIVDLTLGELGSRGTVELRRKEARKAADILGVAERVNLELPDGNIENTPANRLQLIRALRRYRPRLVLIGAPECRHPDHKAATDLSVAAIFQAGLSKIKTVGPDHLPQEPHRPDHVLQYMQAIAFEPTLSVDVTAFWDQRTRAVRAFESQFHNPDYRSAAEEPETYISNPDFFEWMESRARYYGYPIGARYAEPFLYRQGPIGVDDLQSLLSRSRRFK